MDETLVTIPGATAHHVLGHSSVTLGAGDLNLLPASAGPKHDLMLTVGSAGFSLHRDTMFGTLEGDSRAYVFSPEIEGVRGGYGVYKADSDSGGGDRFVKITLPEGVEEDDSRLSALQTKFEQVLIAHGLLQPGRSDPGKPEDEEAGAGGHHAAQHTAIALGDGTRGPEPLVTIPRCVAAQVLGEEIVILSEGTLSVVVVPDLKSGEEEEPVLTLTVGESAFLLYKNAAFGTLANDSRTYVFKPVSEGTDEGFVAIVLPDPDAADGASPNVTSLQNDLELVLVEYGLLKDGFDAVTDEVSRSLREGGSRTAQRIRKLRLRSASYELSNVAYSVSRGAERGMQSLADVAHGVSGAVLGAALVAGAVVTNALMPSEEQPGSPTRTTRPVEGMEDVKDSSQASEDGHLRNVQDYETRKANNGTSFVSAVVGAEVADGQNHLGPKAESVQDDLSSDQGQQRAENDKGDVIVA
ncbi:hypothetical protein GSI_03337 [Ganoderma sinense ZZ0214-1]|uniref:Senescence domain-containing protein n=1 Tax=Ganoderma sinense ZZ0214-1 TaxID=1077348 RepID=A0A2G8SLC5_9APHY|nr:hypothetical protein GSI_03337 [Ganoderma sinense ZZ0214-1]